MKIVMNRAAKGHIFSLCHCKSIHFNPVSAGFMAIDNYCPGRRMRSDPL